MKHNKVKKNENCPSVTVHVAYGIKKASTTKKNILFPQANFVYSDYLAKLPKYYMNNF
jgi:hypothetical protein